MGQFDIYQVEGGQARSDGLPKGRCPYGNQTTNGKHWLNGWLEVDTSITVSLEKLKELKRTKKN